MPDNSTGRAVVIEDDDDIRLLISTVLEQRGLDVRGAASGLAGLALVQEHQPDLVTLDLGLPDIEGFEVCRRLRTISDAYVVMVSASGDEVDQLLGLEIGADDYITKPFSPRDLKARVGAMLRRPRLIVRPEPAVQGGSGGGPSGSGGGPAAGDAAPPASRAPAVGAPAVVTDDQSGVARVVVSAAPGSPPPRMRVDLEGREVVLDGFEVALTRIEFDLLAAFVTHPRRVWSREALLRSVWRTEWAQDTHLVEVHVGNLRRKLGDDPWIRTVRGVGYRFNPLGVTVSD
jgi:two-component system OmpR family response regulator